MYVSVCIPLFEERVHLTLRFIRALSETLQFPPTQSYNPTFPVGNYILSPSVFYHFQKSWGRLSLNLMSTELKSTSAEIHDRVVRNNDGLTAVSDLVKHCVGIFLRLPLIIGCPQRILAQNQNIKIVVRILFCQIFPSSLPTAKLRV